MPGLKWLAPTAPLLGGLLFPLAYKTGYTFSIIFSLISFKILKIRIFILGWKKGVSIKVCHLICRARFSKNTKFSKYNREINVYVFV